MDHGLLMGLDLGGGGARCLLLETGSGRVTTVLRPWFSQPAPGVPLGMQYDPAGTWAAVSVARALPPVTGALGMLGVPLLGIASSAVLVGESITTSLLLGTALVIAGIAIVILDRKN